MESARKRLLSGIKPTGTLHIGNFFGAMRQFLRYQEEYESFLFIADYHALTTARDAARLRENIFHIAAAYLAIGLDPHKAVLFRQSDIAEHTELAWVFNSITPMSVLLRAHAYKDAQANNKDVTVGTFDYPLLMAADILLYDPHVVPTGKDQKQHIEIARDTATRFNGYYGECFRQPEPLIEEATMTVPGTDGRKMSKSYRNTIPLLGSDEELEQAVLSIKTDSKGEHEPKDPDTDTVFALHRLFSPDSLEALEERYRAGSIGYRESKELLLDHIRAFCAPYRERYESFMENRSALTETLAAGAEVARERAAAKMKDVRKRAGITLP